MAAMTSITKYCKVYDCRFSDNHVTAEHRCGICKNKGHGQTECSNQRSKDRLVQFHAEILPHKLHCTRPKCESKQLHTTLGHFCKLCSKQHSHHNCDTNPQYIARKMDELTGSAQLKTYKLLCPICRTDNEYSDEHISSGIQEIKCCVCTEDNKKLIFLPACKHFNLCTDCAASIRHPTAGAGSAAGGDGGGLRSFGPDTSYDVLNDFATEHFRGREGKLYMQLYAGMGWSWFVRRHRIGELVELMIIDGQFDDLTLMNSFIENYTKVDQLY